MVDLYIDSVDRINGTPNDFEVILNDVYDTSGQWNIALKSMQFANLSPNVINGVNDTFETSYVTQGGEVDTALPIELPKDYYTINEIILALEAGLTNIYGNYATTGADGTRWFKFDFDTTNQKVVIIADYDSTALVANSLKSITFQRTPLLDQLGIVGPFTLSITSGSAVQELSVAKYPPTLTIPYVDVHINFPMTTYHSSGRLSNVLQRVPVGLFGSWTLWENDDMGVGQLMKAHYLTVLRIRITIPNGLPFETPPHLNFSFHFKLTRADL